MIKTNLLTSYGLKLPVCVFGVFSQDSIKFKKNQC